MAPKRNRNKNRSSVSGKQATPAATAAATAPAKAAEPEPEVVAAPPKAAKASVPAVEAPETNGSADAAPAAAAVPAVVVTPATPPPKAATTTQATTPAAAATAAAAGTTTPSASTSAAAANALSPFQSPGASVVTGSGKKHSTPQRLAQALGTATPEKHHISRSGTHGVESFTLKRGTVLQADNTTLALNLARWMTIINPDSQMKNVKDLEEFFAAIQPGVELCNLVNKIAPEFKTPVRPDAKTGFLAIDNVQGFTETARKMGVDPKSIFDPTWLAERKHDDAVITTLMHISDLAAQHWGKPPVWTREEEERLFGKPRTPYKAISPVKRPAGTPSGKNTLDAEAAAKLAAQKRADEEEAAAKAKRAAEELEAAAAAAAKKKADDEAAAAAAAAAKKKADDEAAAAAAAAEAKRLADLAAAKAAAEAAERKRLADEAEAARIAKAEADRRERDRLAVIAAAKAEAAAAAAAAEIEAQRLAEERARQEEAAAAAAEAKRAADAKRKADEAAAAEALRKKLAKEKAEADAAAAAEEKRKADLAAAAKRAADAAAAETARLAEEAKAAKLAAAARERADRAAAEAAARQREADAERAREAADRKRADDEAAAAAAAAAGAAAKAKADAEKLARKEAQAQRERDAAAARKKKAEDDAAAALKELEDEKAKAAAAAAAAAAYKSSTLDASAIWASKVLCKKWRLPPTRKTAVSVHSGHAHAKKEKGLISTINPDGFIAPHVHKEMYAENRRRLIDLMNAAVSDKKAVGAIVLQGGTIINKYDTDSEFVFRQESHFYYLFGCPESDCYGAIDLHSKTSILFIPRLGVEYEIWCGKVKPLDFYKSKYGADEVRYVDEIADVLKQRNVTVLHTLVGTNSDSGSPTKPAEFKGMDAFPVRDTKTLYPTLCECRVIKTERELNLMRYVNKVSSDAHVAVMREAKTVKTEHELEAIFQYHSYRFANCRHMSYTCICCSGENSAVLHYGHAGAPNDKKLQAGDMLLLDMGAEYHGYASDITCSYPATGKFTEGQKNIYEAVRAAQVAVMNEMKPGVLWSNMHRLAEKVILEHLLKHKFIQLADSNLHDLQYVHHIAALFMPHGLGHLLGLDTHDVGGYPEGEAKRPGDPGIKRLRTNRVLRAGMVLTVEPGLYFIDALLTPAFANAAINKYLNVPKIKEYLDFGGVRLEDDVIVTPNGCENMTNCPRSVADVESVMAGGSWPPTPAK